jgi:hypothetical protein
MLMQPLPKIGRIEAEVERMGAGRSRIPILFDTRSFFVQLRITRTAQKTIKIARSQIRLRAIGTERLNCRLWRTEIFLLRKESHQSPAARVSLNWQIRRRCEIRFH